MNVIELSKVKIVEIQDNSNFECVEVAVKIDTKEAICPEYDTYIIGQDGTFEKEDDKLIFIIPNEIFENFESELNSSEEYETSRGFYVVDLNSPLKNAVEGLMIGIRYIVSKKIEGVNKNIFCHNDELYDIQLDYVSFIYDDNADEFTIESIEWSGEGN